MRACKWVLGNPKPLTPKGHSLLLPLMLKVMESSCLLRQLRGMMECKDSLSVSLQLKMESSCLLRQLRGMMECKDSLLLSLPLKMDRK